MHSLHACLLPLILFLLPPSTSFSCIKSGSISRISKNKKLNWQDLESNFRAFLFWDSFCQSAQEKMPPIQEKCQGKKVQAK
mmetsp:Transcript_7242/g.9279  ORF Transcript_7242/g.9279 Transcript_7242/m.9279 type:complete len:81 (-) Transcript_7242:241-483(-)